MGDGIDDRIKRFMSIQTDQVDTELLPCFVGVCHRVVHQRLDAVAAQLFDDVRAMEFLESSVLLSDGSELPAGLMLNATGTWASEVMPDLPVRPKKGHLAITDRYPGFLRHQVIELGYLKSAHGGERESVAFNVQPRPTGQILVGSSRQIDTADTNVEPLILGRMVRRALEYMPGLASLSTVRTWTGFRAATSDNLPLP